MKKTVVIAFSDEKNIALYFDFSYNDFMIKTERLELFPLTKKIYKSLLANGTYGAYKMVKPFEVEVIKAIEEDFRKFKNNDYLMMWSIWLVVKDDLIIGNAGFKNIPYDTVDIAYEIFEPFRRQGYCLEAVEGLIDFALDKDVQVFRADCALDNIASANLLEKLGFKLMNIKEEKHYEKKYD